MKTTRAFISIMVVFLLILGTSAFLYAAEEKFPTKPVTIFCGYSAGGSTDIQIRTVLPYLQKHLGQPIVVENLTGASGTLAYNKVFTSPPDGYTLLVSCLEQLMLTEHFFKDTARYHTPDYTYIHNLVKEDSILVTHPELYGSMQEFIKAAQNKKLRVGIPGKWQYCHLTAVLVERLAKVSFNLIPFDGGAPGMASLMGKHIDAFMTMGSTSVNIARAGNIRPLLLMAKTRTPQYPEVPVPSDLGYDTAETLIPPYYTGIYGPPKMAPDRIRILEAAFAKAVKEPEYLEKVNKMNIEVSPIGADKFRLTAEQEYPFIVKFIDILGK